MARQTKATKFKRLAQGIANIREGRRPMPSIRTDGSMTTKPRVPCPDVPESEVSEGVLEWLTRHGCTVDRLNNGAGQLVNKNGSLSEFQQFGIKGGGDYIGMLPDGRHLEVECKKGSGGRLSKAQCKRLMRVRNGGGIYVYVHGVPELVKKLLPILNKGVDMQSPPW